MIRLKRAVLDTSVLMLAYEGVDVIGEIERVLESKPELVVTSRVVEELQRLASSQSTRKRRAARLALQLVERYCKVVSAKGETADDTIIDYVVRDREAIVVTADRELRRRLRELGIPHIYYKEERKGFKLEG